jgi:hypothetical protein
LSAAAAQLKVLLPAKGKPGAQAGINGMRSSEFAIVAKYHEFG